MPNGHEYARGGYTPKLPGVALLQVGGHACDGQAPAGTPPSSPSSRDARTSLEAGNVRRVTIPTYTPARVLHPAIGQATSGLSRALASRNWPSTFRKSSIILSGQLTARCFHSMPTETSGTSRRSRAPLRGAPLPRPPRDRPLLVRHSGAGPTSRHRPQGPRWSEAPGAGPHPREDERRQFVCDETVDVGASIVVRRPGWPLAEWVSNTPPLILSKCAATAGTMTLYRRVYGVPRHQWPRSPRTAWTGPGPEWTRRPAVSFRRRPCGVILLRLFASQPPQHA
jgi:hypothetical protein